MVKKQSSGKNKISTTELLGFIAAAFYMQSVLTVAHHTSLMPHDGASFTVGPPAIPALTIGLVASLYSVRKNKYAFTPIVIISLTILVTSSIFWLSGLRVNFHF